MEMYGFENEYYVNLKLRSSRSTIMLYPEWHDYVTKREVVGPSKTTSINGNTQGNRGTGLPKDPIQMWQGVVVLTELWWNNDLTKEMQSTHSICMSFPSMSVSQ